MKRFIFLFFIFCLSVSAKSQCTFNAVVKSKTTKLPLANVSVSVANRKLGLSSDSGFVHINHLKCSIQHFTVALEGYETQTIDINLPDTITHEILLSPKETTLDEVVIIASTRTNAQIENSPLKVEVLGKEEMEEENAIKPGNIASILGDISGIQIQQSSATSGNSNVKIQGLDGRYTQILRDGMPLYDGFSGGFGIMQIPPLDLKQVELIKGCASTLYGSGAIGGLVNLISKKPTEQQEVSVTLNHTTLQESNVNMYAAKRNGKFGYTFYWGLNHQQAKDVNKDGFSDVPKLSSIVVHPRLFFYPSEKTTVIAGYTGTWENRLGGDMEVLLNNANTIHQYFEENKNQRSSGEFSIEHQFDHNQVLTIKTSLSSFTRAIHEDDLYFKGNQLSYYSEAALFIPFKKSNLVTGVNFTGTRFKKLPSDEISLTDYDNKTVGAFTQYSAFLASATTLEMGLRADHQTNYGNFVLPRLAIFHRFNENWATRLGVGWSYKSPDPLAPQNIDYPIQTIQPLPKGIKAEKSVGYNAEFNFKKELGEHSSIFINQAFFLTRINTPVVATQLDNQQVVFNNMNKPIITKGFDTYIQLSLDEWEIYAGYTFTIAERKYLSENQFLPLTPKNRFAFTLMKEFEDRWRLGLEGSFTGSQFRDNESKTPAYFFMAAMLERKFGNKLSMVLNAENLLNYSQGKQESLYTGTISDPVFKPLWAPIDGRVINLSVRLKAF